MAWCHQVTRHYLIPCWLRSMSPYCVTRPQWVNFEFRKCLVICCEYHCTCDNESAGNWNETSSEFYSFLMVQFNLFDVLWLKEMTHRNSPNWNFNRNWPDLCKLWAKDMICSLICEWICSWKVTATFHCTFMPNCGHHSCVQMPFHCSSWVGGFSKVVVIFNHVNNHVNGSFNLFMATTRDVWIITHIFSNWG